MTQLTLRRIRLGSPEAAAELIALRHKLGAQGNVVSPRSQALTLEVFGEALSPAAVVERVCADVRRRGVEALLHYTERFDKVRLGADTLRVTRSEMALAHASADPDFL